MQKFLEWLNKFLEDFAFAAYVRHVKQHGPHNKCICRNRYDEAVCIRYH